MLRRDITTTNVLIAAAGGMVGSGWLFSPYISAQIAGSNSLVSWVIATIFMLFIALPLCELGTMFPISGGMSNYPTFTHGKEVGFLFAWTSWLSYVVMTPIEIQAILQYTSHFFPSLVAGNSVTLQLSSYGYLAAVAIMLFVVLLNSYGIKLLAECNKYASIIKFILPSIAIVSLLHVAPSMSNVSVSLTDKDSWVKIFAALSEGGVVFAFTGFQNGLILAGEVKNPQRSIPIAILGAVIIGFILYFLLQLSFIAAVPQKYLAHGWAGLTYPGDSGPLVGLALSLGLAFVAILLMIDASFSPFGTALVYTAATSRILYGMAQNKHLPKIFLKVNRHKIPYITLYANLIVGMLSFLPFPGWQKLVAFLSSASILSYSIGPICLLAMRKLQPDTVRPFRLSGAVACSHLAFYFCNLMLYWCGFAILWKLDVALLIGIGLYFMAHRKSSFDNGRLMCWFMFYMVAMLLLSYLGAFGGIGALQFPFDLICIFPLSIFILYLSQSLLKPANYQYIFNEKEGVINNKKEELLI
ncbi:MAG: APC family permease [Legionella sp.]|uniref:APC family permease n=1 Tax=Legionella sp. TaxID=459 RepID=UPI0039E49006